MSYRAPSPGGMYPMSSSDALATHHDRFLEKDLPLSAYTSSRGSKRSLTCMLWSAIAIVAVAAAVIVPVYFTVIRPHHASTASSANGTDGAAPNGSKNGTGSTSPVSSFVLTGQTGSTVTTENGSTFTYTNPFGGYWYFDSANPFTGGGKANSWTPAINDTWDWASNKIHGVNLGGWLTLEPFITPAIFQKYQNIATPAVDEWTLHSAMRADTSPGGGIGQLEQHYATFITEQDFADIAGAGLNWVRIPMPFWAIGKMDFEPFIDKVAWTYFVKALEWARKYGLRINLDLHAVPGSQNSWNHSGKQGTINWLRTVMGVANAERTLSYIRVITEFISQKQYSNIVQIFGVVNEPWHIGNDVLGDFYFQAYNLMRSITGFGEGNGPIMSMHSFVLDGQTFPFQLQNADRLAMDFHMYTIFGTDASNAPASSFAAGPCNSWGPNMNTTWQVYGLATAGEFSSAINDCGLWVEQGAPSNYAEKFGANSCDKWINYKNWTPDTISGLKNFFMTQADSLQNWFYWTWKIDPSSISGEIEAPFWSYKLGLAGGWIPTDPRSTIGACAAMGITPANPFDPTSIKSWQTGGAGAGNIAPTATNDFPWPPPTLSDEPNAKILPTYTPTGAIITLPAPTFTEPAGASGSVDGGNGWFDAQDVVGMYVPVAGCNYPPAWSASGAAIPPLCTGS